ncbi:MAG: type 1 glutamine amidotransferase [Methylotenera sp.]|nr:type 1 glutamine amidotransferase [Oligoflexia bacterium]
MENFNQNSVKAFVQGNRSLKGLRIAVIATDGFEESELTSPVAELRQAGAQVSIIAPEKGTIQGFKHHDKSIEVPVDIELKDFHLHQFDALVLPGGALNADALRMIPEVQAIVREFEEAGRPIAAICHGAWTLISSGIVAGHTLTSYSTIQDDIRNAGGNWVNQEVVVDKNWITSRSPDDLPAFNRECIRVFSESFHNRLQESA